jgi:hypothetical protein
MADHWSGISILTGLPAGSRCQIGEKMRSRGTLNLRDVINKLLQFTLNSGDAVVLQEEVRLAIHSKHTGQFPTIFLRCDASSTTSAPAYTQVCPSLAQKEQTGFSPGHLVFFRLQKYQLSVTKQPTVVLTDSLHKLVLPVSPAALLLWVPL